MRRVAFKAGIAIVLAATLGLGGCFKVAKAIPADAPSYIKAYPGAGQVVVLDVVGMKSVVFQAAATPADVVAYYRGLATSAQLAEAPVATPSNAVPGQIQAQFGDPKTANFLIVVARPGAQGQGTMVDLTYKPAAKAGS